MRHIVLCLLLAASFTHAEERTVVDLRDFSAIELRSQGIELKAPVTFHITALGGGGDAGWTYKSNTLFAYGWILNADTRELVWKMDVGNTRRSGDDRLFDGSLTLQPGSYEVYFTAYAFAYHSLFNHYSINIDHRKKQETASAGKRGFFSWFSGPSSDDMMKDWDTRSRTWGISLAADGPAASGVGLFTAPKERSNELLRAPLSADNELIRRGFSIDQPMTVLIYAVGEQSFANEFADCGWIVRREDRTRAWEMDRRVVTGAGGSRKNIQCWENVSLEPGEYVLYAITDGSHSPADWNDAPPYDPLNYGVTIFGQRETDRQHFKLTRYNEDQNVIVSLTRIGDNQYRTQGFTLKEEADVRVLAFGERSNSRRQMADFGAIMDAKTRARVWTMDLDRTFYAGGASKNRYIDEIVHLPRGSYLVTYTSDDSHAYGEWNDDPPFDPEHYGITVMGAGPGFKSSIVGRYVEERDRNVIAQILHPGNDEDRVETFRLDKTTRVRVYAIGEGQNREMYDYGVIEDARTGSVVWEMTYGMTFHAGGGRKNRMVNTTLLLERGQYRLRWRSDDSHSFGDWNVDPPDDQQYWGISLFRDDGPEAPGIPPRAEHPVPPVPPAPSAPSDGNDED